MYTHMYTRTHTENLKFYRHDVLTRASSFLQYIQRLGTLRAKRRRTPHPTATTFTQWPHPVCGSQENGRLRTVVISTPQRSLSNFFTLHITKGKFMIRIGFVPSDSAVFQILTICLRDMQRMIKNSELPSNEITIHELHYKITNI